MHSGHIATYILDTVQVYFAWDDDLYTYFKQIGFGQSGFRRKTLPIIYTDNCESTSGVPARGRRCVINPKYFGKTYEELGWTQTDKESQPIIPSEKPTITISLMEGDRLQFKIDPHPDGKEQYHLEYSSMSAFGRTYVNWAIPVLTINDFKDLLSRLQKALSLPSTDMLEVQIHVQKKQAQREHMFYVEVPLIAYKFSIGEFFYAREFLRLNGVGGLLPSLVFKNEPIYLEKLEPVLKVGFIQTCEAQGFETRRPQIALKIAQPKVTTSLRGKLGKAKGMIEEHELYENFFVVPARTFSRLTQAIVRKYALK